MDITQFLHGLKRCATLQKFLGLLLEGGSANLKQEAETLLKDPAESGIDWNAPLYVFEAPTLHNTAITLKIADLKKFEAMLRLLAQEQLCTAPVEAGGYRSVEIKDAGVLLAYNDGTLLGVYGGSTEQLKKLQPAITALMQQPADKSIRTGAVCQIVLDVVLVQQLTGSLRIAGSEGADQSQSLFGVGLFRLGVAFHLAAGRAVPAKVRSVRQSPGKRGT